jgi:hypothetical protein
MNENDTKLKVDALEWRVELPVASKAALRVRFSSFFSLSLSRARVFAFILFRSLALLPREHFP